MDLNKEPIEPLSILGRICDDKKWTLDYNSISVTGKARFPSFTWCIYIDELNLHVVAAEFSKRKAKQSAVLKALQILSGEVEEAADALARLEKTIKSESETQTNVNNPIGELQEICVSRRWELPIYLTEEEHGPPHEKSFTIICKLQQLNLHSRGNDTTIKGGKKIAAQQMLKILSEMEADLD